MIAFRSIVILSLIAFSYILRAQNTVHFTYDNAGNRETRYIEFKKSTEIIGDSNSVPKPVIDWLDEMKLTIYPNPTKGLLSIEISKIPEGEIGEISINAIDGKSMQRLKGLKTSNQLDISAFPMGIYILHIKFGDKISDWKIVKE